jgi:DNA/RNA-binding protein KIN17
MVSSPRLCENRRLIEIAANPTSDSHVQSESHVRQVLLIGEDPKKYIDDYSQQFLRNFVDLLKTTHGEKKVHMNQFYQQIIADKTHIHMNATRWTSLTQFALYLGREGICRVEETEKGLFISWIDNSPETLRRREAVLKKERQDKGDEDREQRQIQEQIERAQRHGEANEEISPEAKLLQRKEGEKLKLSFGSGQVSEEKPDSLDADTTRENTPAAALAAATTDTTGDQTEASTAANLQQEESKPGVKLSLSSGDKKPKNVFAAMRNPLGGKKSAVVEPPKKMTQQERIMKTELEAMERKRVHSQSTRGIQSSKRQKVQ